MIEDPPQTLGMPDYTSLGRDKLIEEHKAMFSTLSAMQSKQTKLVEQNRILDSKIINYETQYILPVFRWGKEIGIDVQELVLNSTGKNCVELFFNTLLEENRKLKKLVSGHCYLDPSTNGCCAGPKACSCDCNTCNDFT